MAGTVHTKAYQDLLKALIQQRIQAGLSQAGLAQRIGKPASFVGKYELGERRLDVIELLVILQAVDLTFTDFWGSSNIDLPSSLSR